MDKRKAYAAVPANISIGRALVKTASMRAQPIEKPTTVANRATRLCIKYRTRTARAGIVEEMMMLTARVIRKIRVLLQSTIPMFA